MHNEDLWPPDLLYGICVKKLCRGLTFILVIHAPLFHTTKALSTNCSLSFLFIIFLYPCLVLYFVLYFLPFSLHFFFFTIILSTCSCMSGHAICSLVFMAEVKASRLCHSFSLVTLSLMGVLLWGSVTFRQRLDLILTCMSGDLIRSGQR